MNATLSARSRLPSALAEACADIGVDTLPWPAHRDVVPSGFALRMDGTPANALGAALLAKRLRYKSTRRHVADLLGVTASDLGALESGAARPEGPLSVRVGAWLGWSRDRVALSARIDPPATE